MDESILSLPFVRPGVLVQCSNCGEKAADVYAKNEEAALAGQGVCNNCAPKVVAPLPVAPVEETEAVPEAEESAEAAAEPADREPAPEGPDEVGEPAAGEGSTEPAADVSDAPAPDEAQPEETEAGTA